MTTAVFTASGTWIFPGSVTWVYVECTGGGGGGGSADTTAGAAGGGGGGGEYAAQWILVVPGTAYAVTAGTAGAGGAAGGNGGTGGNSSFTGATVTVTAHGGSGGTGASTDTGGGGGAGGTGSTNTLVNAGGSGAAGVAATTSGAGGGSAGSGSVGGNASGTTGGSAGTGTTPGGAGAAGLSANGSGTAAAATGGGGSGALDKTGTTSRPGGAGFAGQVRLTYTVNEVWSLPQPAGLRLTWMRAGHVQASLIPPPAPAVTPPAASHPLSQPARARITPPPRGRVHRNQGAPAVHAGPAVRPLTQPARARQPLPARGRATTARTPLVTAPAPAVSSPLRPLTQPVRARLPFLLTGRAATMALLPVPQNPSAGPAFTPPAEPARARQPFPPRGRAYGNKGAPVSNPAPPAAAAQQVLTQPAGVLVYVLRAGHVQASVQSSPVTIPTAGPPFRQATSPARARQPFPPRGRTYGSRGTPVSNPVPPAAVTARPLGPVRAKLPVPLLPGRAATMAALPVPSVPSQGPAAPPLRQPAQARRPFPPRGRTAGNPGAPVRNPAPPAVVTVRPLGPVRARLPVPLLPGRAATMAVLPVPSVPGAGVPFPSRTSPARSPVPVPPRGRAYGNHGAPVSNPPQSSGPPFYPLRQPARARRPLPPRGRAYTALPYKAPVNPVPSSGPPFPPLGSPAGLRVIFRRTGTGSGNPGTPVITPVTPAPVYPLTRPVQARRLRPAHLGSHAPGRQPGHRAGSPVPPARPGPHPGHPPAAGPHVREQGRPGGPCRARVPAGHVPGPRPSRSRSPRAASRATRPVHNPVTGQGPPFYPQGTIRFRVTQPPRGRTYSDKGAPAVHAGPQFRQAASPARAPVAAPFSKGRASGSRGAPVQNPVTPAPFRQATSPVRAPVPQPFSRGRAAFTRRTPVVNPSAPAYPQGKALRAQPAVFLKGRIVTTPRGIIHNPSSGPVFQLPTQPARYRITLPPRGRAYGNPGGPVSNPVEGAVPPGTLYLTPGTIIQGQAYAATTIATGGGILTISNAEGAVTVITPAAEGYAPSSVTPPPDSDIPPPDSVVVPAYVQR